MFYDVLVAFSEQYEKWPARQCQGLGKVTKIWLAGLQNDCFAPCGCLGVDSMSENAAKGALIWSMLGCVEMGTFSLSTLWIGFSDMIHDSMLCVVTWDISCTETESFGKKWLRHRWNQHGHPYWKARRSESNGIHVILTTDCIGRFLGQLGWYLLESARLESSTPLQRLADSSQWGCCLVLGNHAGDGPRFLLPSCGFACQDVMVEKQSSSVLYQDISLWNHRNCIIYTYNLYIYTSYHLWGFSRHESTGELWSIFHLWRLRYILHWLLSCRRLSQEPKKIGIQRCFLDPLVKVHFSSEWMCHEWVFTLHCLGIHPK